MSTSGRDDSQKALANTLVKIYILLDPRTGLPRYVGKTVRGLMDRKRAHLSKAQKSKRRCRRVTWLRKLIRLDLKPAIQQIDEVEIDRWEETETTYIRLFKSFGADLVNTSDGGDGPNGWHHTEETKKKISESMKGRRFTKEHKAKIGEGNTGNKRPDLSKRNRQRTGTLLSEETKEKIGRANRGKKQSPDTIRKRGRARRRPWTELSMSRKRARLGSFKRWIVAHA